MQRRRSRLLYPCHDRFEIISTKESGVIYGWQLEPSGAIKYGKSLPPDTQISRCSSVHVHCSNLVYGPSLNNEVCKSSTYMCYIMTLQKFTCANDAGFLPYGIIRWILDNTN